MRQLCFLLDSAIRDVGTSWHFLTTELGYNSVQATMIVETVSRGEQKSPSTIFLNDFFEDIMLTYSERPGCPNESNVIKVLCELKRALHAIGNQPAENLVDDELDERKALTTEKLDTHHSLVTYENQDSELFPAATIAKEIRTADGNIHKQAQNEHVVHHSPPGPTSDIDIKNEATSVTEYCDRNEHKSKALEGGAINSNSTTSLVELFCCCSRSRHSQYTLSNMSKEDTKQTHKHHSDGLRNENPYSFINVA